MNLVTGLQLFSRDIWDEADEALRCKLLQVALPQLPLLVNSAEREWWLQSESDMCRCIDDNMLWYVRSCKHQNKSKTCTAFIDSLQDTSLGDVVVSHDHDSLILRDRYGPGQGALIVVFVDLDGRVETRTFAIKSTGSNRFHIELKKPKDKFFMAFDFDKSVKSSSNPVFRQATELASMEQDNSDREESSDDD